MTPTPDMAVYDSRAEDDAREKTRRREAVLFWAFILAVFAFAMIGMRIWADMNVTP